MRLWSLHPGYLDSQGLVALWREALLAQKVLAGKTRGYKNHPQLERFKAHPHPPQAIAAYLVSVWEEAFGEKVMCGKTTTGTIRSTVVVGPDGMVVKQWAKVAKAEQHPDQVVAYLLG